jgi:hypothetical protein
MGAEYYIEPANSDQEALDQAEFVQENLFDSPSSPWLVTVARILKFCEYGFSVMEPVFENRPWAPDRKMANRKTYTMLRKLAPRPAISIERIDYDRNGGPIQIIQNALMAKPIPNVTVPQVQIGPLYEVEQVAIPIEKAIVFTNDEEGGDLMGKSMLRSAYPHWYYGQHLYKVDAIQKERHGIGIPRAILPPGIKNESDKNAAKELVRQIRTNEHAGIVQPDGWDIDFVEVKGHPVNVIASIEHHNGMIMLNVLAEFLIAGLQETGGGARAVSASQQDIFMKANRALADIICDSINLYLIPQLVHYNFTNVAELPRLMARNLGDTKDLQQTAAALANMFDKEIITPDLETEQWARKVFDMPQKIGPRPTLSPTQIREVINQTLQTQGNTPVTPNLNAKGGATAPGSNGGASGIGNKSNKSSVGRQQAGNMGLGKNVS